MVAFTSIYFTVVCAVLFYSDRPDSIADCNDPQLLLSVWSELERQCWCWNGSGQGRWQTLSDGVQADETVTAIAVQSFVHDVLVPELRDSSKQLQVCCAILWSSLPSTQLKEAKFAEFSAQQGRHSC